MERRKIIFPPKNKKQKKRSFSRFLFYFLFLSFWGAAVYALFFSPFLQVSSIEISGNEKIKSENILSEISPKMEGKYFSVLEKNNLLLIGANSMEKDLLGKFRQIRNIKIKKKFPDKIKIEIQERETKMIINDGENNYLLDENGQAYDQIDSNSNEAMNLVFLRDDSRKKINLGDMVLEKDYMNYILGIKDELKSNLDLEIENNFWTPNLISGDIRVKTKEGWNIYFNKEIDLVKETESFGAVLKEKIPAEQRPDLEYVDLRIDNKVYYKFKPAPEDQNNKEEITKE